VPPVPVNSPRPGRLLITAGPTHEPIDSVRYIGNRSSGRLGIALAHRAAANGWSVTLLLGPTGLTIQDSRISLHRFRTTAELQRLLEAQFPACDALVMAAAVADYRPATGAPGTKLPRGTEELVLRLEPTPDLLASVAATKRPDQIVVGFALEPQERLLESAAAKLERKGLDMIVANPLATMESEDIDAVILRAGGAPAVRPGPMSKSSFADVLLRQLETERSSRNLAGARR
jgi:phosphopantothenoylcysteine decarboxylase/phosphopantothenate--cysteine ligase